LLSSVYQIKNRITGDPTPPLNIEPIVEPNPNNKVEYVSYDSKAKDREKFKISDLVAKNGVSGSAV